MNTKSQTTLLNLVLIASAALLGSAGAQSLVNGKGVGITDPFAFRKAAKAETYDATVGFYDNFDDRKRYPDGTQIVTSTSMPLVGSAPWRLSENPVTTRIYNGAFSAPRDTGLAYLGSSVTTKNDGTFSMGFEFSMRTTHKFSAINAGGVNISFDSNVMIASGPTPGITPAGVVHCNLDTIGIRQLNNYGTGVTFQGEADDDTITTLAAADFLTGELVAIADDIAGGTQLPTGIVNGGSYYAIQVPGQPNKIKLATTRANALAGTAIDLTTDGTSALNTVEVAYECLNRTVTNFGASWLPMAEDARSFQGATNDYLSLNLPHSLSTGEAVRVEGTGLPAPLVSGTTYYAITDSFSRQLRLAATATDAVALTATGGATTSGSNAITFSSTTNVTVGAEITGTNIPAGTRVTTATSTTATLSANATGTGSGITFTLLRSVDLTTAGSAEQGIYWTKEGISGPTGLSMAANRKYLLLVEVEGTTVTYNLVGVGAIKYHNRKLPEKIGPTTYFWWEPGGASLNSAYREVPDLHSVFAEAPAIRKRMVDYFAGGPASQFAAGGPYSLRSSLSILSAVRGMSTDFPFNMVGVRLYAAADSTTDIGSGNLRFNGGHVFAEGGFINNLGGANTGNSQYGRALMGISTVAGAVYPVSSAATADNTETTLRSISSLGYFNAGDSERVTICGNLAGTSAKRIRIDAQSYGTVYFDSNRAQTYTVATATEIFTATQHQFETGDVVQVSTTTTIPIPLVELTNYYVIRLGADTFKLAATEEEANAGTAINMTSNGAGTQTITARPLDSMVGAYEIHIFRNMTATASHTYSVKMMLPNGDWLPPQRTGANHGNNYTFLNFKTTTVTAGGVTIDGVFREAGKVISN